MTSKELLLQKGFNFKWENEAEKSTSLDDNFFEMRDWQIEAFNKLKHSSNLILNAPMGSGKSWFICALSAYKISQDKNIKCIITVPQTIISSGFIEAKLQLPNGERIHWKIKHNLCKNINNRGTVNYVINWLNKSTIDSSDRILLCTHATIVAAYKKLKNTNNLDLINNFLLWIDEAHHIKNVPLEEFQNTVINNGIGEIVYYFLNNQNLNLQVGLTTASFFGDRYSLLTNEMENHFTRFNLPYDQYFKSMKHLKSFSFDFLTSGPDYINAVEKLIQEKKAKDVIYIPHPTSQFSSGNKIQEVNNIIKLYKRTFHDPSKESFVDENGVTVLNKNQTDFKILDLVDENMRDQKKDFLNNHIIKNDANALDAIIALGMFKEGANWIYASRCIIIGSRTSLVDIIQMMGRLFRDCENKEHVEVIQILPFSLDQKDETTFQENLNNYLKAIYASLILENILNPVTIKPIQRADKDTHEKIYKGENKANWLNKVLPDYSDQELLIKEIITHLADQDKTTNDNIPLLYTNYKKIIPEVLDSYGITNYKEETAKQIWLMLIRKTNLMVEGTFVDDIDINLIQKTHPLGFLLRFTSNCNINTFEKLREAIKLTRVSWRPFEESRDFVRALCLKSETEWRLYIDDKITDLEPLPKDIPRAPWVAYKNLGWISWGDFLGTNSIAPRFIKYWSYEDASKFAKSLEITLKDDWRKYCNGEMPHLPKLPSDIPSSPDKTYKRKEYGNKWQGWRHFLGNVKKSNWDKTNNWRSYDGSKKFAQNLNLKTAKEWAKYCNGEFSDLPIKPEDIPRNPDQVYKEWVSWPSFLGSEISKFNCQRDFWSFEVAREFVHKLKLKNQKEWQAYCAGNFTHLPKKPLELPSNPAKKYKNLGWINLKSWLGNE